MQPEPQRPPESRLSAAAMKVGRWFGRRRWTAVPIFLVLLALAVVTLLFVNALVRRLEGELFFAVVVTTLALWGLANARPVRWLLRQWRMRGLSIKRAAVWSVLVLVALPLALGKGYGGVGALLIGFCVGVGLAVRLRWYPWTVAALCGIAAVSVFVWLVSPRVEDGERLRVAGPRAVREDPARQELARSFRPFLLFDERETRFPLDMEDAIATRRVRVCRDKCVLVTNVREIDVGADYLAVDDVTGAPGGDEGSAYYYRVHGPEQGRLYVDYWWYYTRNPSPVAASLGCAPGVRWARLTCHEHPSDWEGITVVLVRCVETIGPCVLFAGESWMPEGVRYAQHANVVSYAWNPALLALWEAVPRRSSTRPVVYVALNSHASYPFSCSRDCEQDETLVGWHLTEARHDGGLWWQWNREDREGCEGCLKPLPLTRNGKPATWNAFPRRWGTQKCILAGTYCDTTGAPESPSRQRRYTDPAYTGPWLCLVERKPPRFEECVSAREA